VLISSPLQRKWEKFHCQTNLHFIEWWQSTVVQSRDVNLTSPQNNNHNREVANCKREIKQEQFDSQHRCVSVALQIRLLLFQLHRHCPSNPKKENTTLLISTRKTSEK
jgi:hypothetical protein